MTLSLHSPLEPLLSLYRQVCVLQARGQVAAAAELVDEEVSPAVDELKATIAISDGELQAMFEKERERVANAGILAELLLPSLTALLGAVRAEPAESRPAQLQAKTAILPSAAPEPRSAPSQGPAEIAGFIDEMLTQQRKPARAARVG